MKGEPLPLPVSEAFVVITSLFTLEGSLVVLIHRFLLDAGEEIRSV